MRFPLSLTASMTKYIAGKRLRGSEKFPLVMMLEPLHACNLTCTSCGRRLRARATDREDAPQRPYRIRAMFDSHLPTAWPS